MMRVRRLPVRLPHLGFLSAVKGMLAKAEAQKDLLVSKGMSVTLLEDLSKGVAEFESTLEASRAGRRDHVGRHVPSRRNRSEARFVMVALRKESGVSGNTASQSAGQDYENL